MGRYYIFQCLMSVLVRFKQYFYFAQHKEEISQAAYQFHQNAGEKHPFLGFIISKKVSSIDMIFAKNRDTGSIYDPLLRRNDISLESPLTLSAETQVFTEYKN